MNMFKESTPVLGGTAPTSAHRTAQKLGGFAVKQISLAKSKPERSLCYLDVGCGNGFITNYVANNIAAIGKITGIDVEPDRLAEFRAAKASDTRFTILEMSANNMQFSDENFDLITSFEVLEHVPDLTGSVSEMIRVCAKGGMIVISVPQTGFPFENHGMRVGNKLYERKIPLLPYFRALHKRHSLARIFSSKEMDALFEGRGMKLFATAYAAPQFERAASYKGTWESNLVFLRDLLTKFETLPVIKQLIGVSMLKAYLKPN